MNEVTTHDRTDRGEGAAHRLRPVVGVALALGLLVACGSAEPAGPDTDGPATSATASTTPEESRAPAPRTVGRVTVGASSVVLGSPEATQRVHIYQDLTCPHCQELHDVMADDVRQWAAGDDVAVEYTVVDYLGPRTTHGFSTRGAGLLALVADVDPAAWPAVQEALFAIQPSATTEEIGDDVLLGAARDAGADIGEVDEGDIASYRPWVEETTAQAAAAGVNFIPQVFVGGELVGGETHEETAALVRAAVGD